jgi:putative acetyltransferase
VSDVVVRQAKVTDRDAIVRVVSAAFGEAGRDPTEEVEIVRSTWGSDRHLPELELVALDGDIVVGHVLTALGEVSGIALPAVAPLAVVPARQRSGIGSALMAEVVRRAERAGHPALLLLGSPTYYGRFGFEPAGPLGIVYPPAGAGSPAFQIRRLAEDVPSFGGEFVYCWELDGR